MLSEELDEPNQLLDLHEAPSKQYGVISSESWKLQAKTLKRKLGTLMRKNKSCLANITSLEFNIFHVENVDSGQS